MMWDEKLKSRGTSEKIYDKFICDYALSILRIETELIQLEWALPICQEVGGKLTGE